MLQVLQPDGQLMALQGADPLLDPRRLTALKELDLLASPPQDALTVINRLASRLLGVPISAMSLISWDQQVTAGQVGLAPDEPRTEPLTAPLSHSFCQHVVRADAPFVVADSRQHELVRDNGAVADDNIIAYAGVPLRVGGQCVGALCACDVQPRNWSDQDVEVLRDLATVAVDALELHRVRRDGGLRDALTGLPRRGLFQEHVGRMLAEARENGPALNVIAVDLMAFRLFNEAWGHDAGDKLLAEVSGRLRRVARDEESVCRLAGDEFLVALRDDADPIAIVGQLEAALSAPPIRIEGVDQPIAAEFVSLRATRDACASDLVDDALASLSATKASRGSTGPAPGEPKPGPALERLQIRNAIGGAVLREELEIKYQPLFDLRTGRIASFEALLRWDHPELGAVSPIDFIPVAERTGAIIPIGEWVLRQACRDVAAWRELSGDERLTVAVNVAPEQVRLPTFDRVVESALRDAGLPASALALEITERTILDDRTVERTTMDALCARGVDLHLDDFGTGYSSLGYLTRFPLSVIKIDRMFVARLGVDPKATALVEGIVKMAGALGLHTIAEGIEERAQADLLRDMGCRHGQGFHLGRPCSAALVPELLQDPVAG